MKTHSVRRAVSIGTASQLCRSTSDNYEAARPARLHKFQWLLAMLFAATVLIAAQSAHGATVFSHSPVSMSSSRTINSNALAHPDGSDHDVTTFDRFALDKAATIASISWRGAASTPAMAGFTVKIYPSKSDSAAQADINNPLAVLHVTGNAEEMKLDDRLSDYRAILVEPLALEAGVQYWLSIVSDRKDLSPWGWAEGSGGDGKSIQSYAEFKVLPAPGDRTFTLDDGR
ncbi:MAG: hypothetical protein WA632_13450 [Gallionella sp.]